MSYGTLVRSTKQFTEVISQISYSSTPLDEVWHPAINAYRCRDCVLICVELAGVDASRIHLQAEPNRLWLHGRRVPPEPPPSEGAPLQVLAMEIDHDRFEREIILQVQVDPSQIHAEQREGLLWIRLPVTPPLDVM